MRLCLMSVVHTLLLPIFLCCICLSTPSFAAESLSVTLLLEHAPDSDWNRLLRQGLDRAAGEFGLAPRVVTLAATDDALAVFRDTAREAAATSGLVLVASQQLHEILRDNAGNFRKARFGCVDAAIRAPNIMCVTFADEQGAYLAGVAAAMRSPRKVVGWLAGEDTPAMRSIFNGFAEGAKLGHPSVRVIQGLAGSFTDAALARAEARRLLAEGVDVLALAAGAANSGALAEAQAAGVAIVGLDVDQANIWPGHVLTSIVKKADEAVYSIVAATARNDFRGKEIRTFDLAGGVSVTDPVRSLGKRDAQLGDISRRMDEVEREIAHGGIRIKSLRDRTLCDCR